MGAIKYLNLKKKIVRRVESLLNQKKLNFHPPYTK